MISVDIYYIEKQKVEYKSPNQPKPTTLFNIRFKIMYVPHCIEQNNTSI